MYLTIVNGPCQNLVRKLETQSTTESECGKCTVHYRTHSVAFVFILSAPTGRFQLAPQTKCMCYSFSCSRYMSNKSQPHFFHNLSLKCGTTRM